MRLAGAMLAAVAALLATAPGAHAAVTCDYSSAGKLLTVDADVADAQLLVVAGEIRVSEGGINNSVACTGPGGPPTVTNTGAISITGGANDKVFINGADDFVPGPDPQDGSDSGGGSKEIEIFVNLDTGRGSELIVTTGDGGGVIIAGTSGINANVVGEVGADADIFPNGGERVSLHGGSGNDELRARGGSGTGGPLIDGIGLDGKDGTDALESGDGPDEILGGPGNESIFGGAGDDTILPGPGNDLANGATGSDTLVLTPSGGQPIAVDLAISGAQPTGEGNETFLNFENASSLDGGPATLRGDDGPNVLTSGSLDDTLEGRGGVDELVATEGADTLLVRDGGPDTVDCGPDSDTVTADAPGIDMLTGCETVIFPAAPAPGGGGTPSAAAFGARTLVRLALARRRIPARGPLAVRVSNGNDFAVSGRLSGRTTKRFAVGQRRRRIKVRPKSFRVAANGRKTVRLRLPKPLRRQLARRRKLSLRLVATVRDPSGNTRIVRKTLRPRLRGRARALP